ncbi:MAG: phosphopantetheine-binding protein [Bacteroidetes bacterium]|nr:phosphopantetheine-binding protein [Bacteroidota bacterium]
MREQSALTDRIERLSPAQRQLVEHHLSHLVDASAVASPAPEVQTQVPTRLVAFIVPNADERPTSDVLRGYLAQCLPEYMIPSAFVFLDDLPRTPNGKVDHETLPRLDGTVANEKESFAQPRNEAEEILVEIWSEVLGQHEISIYDNYFEVGGDSLLSIRILAKARQRGLHIVPEDFFDHPTIAQQASVAAQKAQTGVDHEDLHSPVTPDDSFGASGSAPGSFPLASLDQAELDRVTRMIEKMDEQSNRE